MTERSGVRVRPSKAITSEELTRLLAERVLGWATSPDRFLTGNRRWMPRWRFRPFDRLEDSFKLLDQTITGSRGRGGMYRRGRFRS